MYRVSDNADSPSLREARDLQREVDVQRARRILDQLAGWERDRNEPPSLRDGYHRPVAEDVDWARAVVALRERTAE
jgi:hypothetical protein